MKKRTYTIRCPNCTAVFDISKDIDNWKMGLAQTQKVLKEIMSIMQDNKVKAIDLIIEKYKETFYPLDKHGAITSVQLTDEFLAWLFKTFKGK